MSVAISPLPPGAESIGPVSFLQSGFWGDFKAEHGQKPMRFAVEASADCADLLVLVRPIGAGFCLAYVPCGPEIELPESERSPFLAELSEALRPFLPRRCLFIRFDPPWYAIERAVAVDAEEEGDPQAAASARSLEVERMRPSLDKPLRKAVIDVQPPDTVIVDLSASEDAILAGMKSKWRYNIRLAEKKGVSVEEAGVEAIPVFYRLYGETSQRDKIALHSEGYYRRLFSLAGERRSRAEPGTPDIRLWIAKAEGRALAANVTLFNGRQAFYLFGASSDEKRNLMPTYALQWAAMRAAKSAGCLQYDLYGISPTDDPSHAMGGLYRFKTGFGGAIAHRAGSWDYPMSTFAYGLFRAAEGARAWWYKDLKKRLRRSKRT
jgi:lipid II:glycine glycyltransferase (peptidoglycan interpeptide bridge formation enzyme)